MILIYPENKSATRIYIPCCAFSLVLYTEAFTHRAHLFRVSGCLRPIAKPRVAASPN